MNIVVVGDGKVGQTLAEQLNMEGHDITVIDSNPQALSSTAETLDVLTVVGNGATIGVQSEAGVQDADLVIAATSTDELNLVCCLVAKKLGARHTIARIRNPEYTNELHMFRHELGLSMVINPEQTAAEEIARLASFPSALKVDSFARGRVSLVEIGLDRDSSIIGKKLMDIEAQQKSKVLICAVERDEEAYIPNGHFVLREGDKIHITGKNSDIASFLNMLGQMRYKIKNALIVGGGHITYHLAKIFLEMNIKVKIIEKKEERCMRLCELLPEAMIIHGDGTEPELLESEGISDVGAFITLTNIDEENMITSIYAINKKCRKVVTKINRTGYYTMAKKMGIGSLISPKAMTADQIVRYVRSIMDTNEESIKHLHRIANEKAESIEFIATEKTKYLGVHLEHLPIKKNLLISIIGRKGKIIVPHGKDYIQAGDRVVVVTSVTKLKHLNEIFDD